MNLNKIILQSAPPEWDGTAHGRRSFDYVREFNSWSWSLPPAGESTFTERRLVAWTDYLRKLGLAPGTVNRRVAAVMAVWRRAHRRGMVIERPPSGLYAKEPRGRRRVLSAQEEPRLLSALAEPYRSLAAFLLASGLRVGEALALDRSDLHGPTVHGRWSVRVRDSKNGDARTVPGVDANIPPIHDGRWGPFTGISHSAFNHAFRAAKAAIGLEHDAELVPHSLRHTYATRMVVAGVPLAVVARLLGHRTVRTTMRYSHVSDEDAARWVAKVAGEST
jgi:integrase